MKETFATYCPYCDKEVLALLVRGEGSLEIRGEAVLFPETIAECPDCGAAIGDTRIEGGNLKAAYEAYAASHGLLNPDEVKALRMEYGLSIREFSRFLGFGEQTITKYETGSLPDRLHSNVIKLAANPIGAQLLLELNASFISDASVRKVREYIENHSGQTAFAAKEACC